MRIKNPILRSLAGFAVLTITPTAVVFFLHLIGDLAKPWLERWHLVYVGAGYNFGTSLLYGLTALYIPVLIGLCFFVLFGTSYLAGNRLFGPPVEDVEDTEVRSSYKPLN